jgi:hypothetical protein
MAEAIRLVALCHVARTMEEFAVFQLMVMEEAL